MASNGRVRPSRNSTRSALLPGMRRCPSAKPAIVAISTEIGTTPSTISPLDFSKLDHVRDVERLGEVAPVRIRRPVEPDGYVPRRVQRGREHADERQERDDHQQRSAWPRPSATSRGEAIIAPRPRISHWIGRTQTRTRTISTTARAEARPTWRCGEGEQVDLEARHGRRRSRARPASRCRRCRSSQAPR